MGQHRFRRRPGSGLGQRQGTVAKVGRDRPQAGGQVRRKLVRIAVALVERQPGAGVLTGLDPGAHTGRLAKTGRCTDQAQLALQARVQALYQALRLHAPQWRRGRKQLGGKQGVGMIDTTSRRWRLCPPAP